MPEINPPSEEWCEEHDRWYPADGTCPDCEDDPDAWLPDDVICLGPADPPDFVAQPMGPDTTDTDLYPWPPADDIADWEREQEAREAEERAWGHGLPVWIYPGRPGAN